MDTQSSWFRLLSVVLLAAAVVTLAAPARAEAMDPRLILVIATGVGAVVLIVAYLVVASTRDSRATDLQSAYTGCMESEAAGPMGCGPMPQESTAPAPVPASEDPPATSTQGQ